MWERSIPIYRITLKEINDIFSQFDRNCVVSNYREVKIGCRNSNYIVITNYGSFFLRICPPGDTGYINEKAVFNTFYGIINIPQLYFISEIGGRVCLIYEYINSVSIQSMYSYDKRLDNTIVRRVGKISAILHSYSVSDIAGLVKQNFPPYLTWYDLFLENSNAVGRLGNETVSRVRNLIKDKQTELHEIDKRIAFIHSDFRPANMLICDNNEIYITDWEYANIGHTLGDVGQFFRYRKCFDSDHLSVFEEEYNKHAVIYLPQEWYSLSILRDLVNPLQMIGSEGDRPHLYEDLKNIINDTLEYFRY